MSRSAGDIASPDAVSLVVVTWNVLHRVHAENWGEAAVLARYPDETARTEAIAARVMDLLREGADAVALQEVSGDVLAQLQRVAPPTMRVLDHRHTRVPHPRAGTTHRATLTAATEHLVVVGARDVLGEVVSAGSFAADPGKGWLALTLREVLLVDTHVTYGDGSAAQLRHLGDAARAHAGPAVILGDFNAAASTVCAGFGSDFACGVPTPGSLPTRPRASGDKAQTIDHIVVCGGSVSAIEVLEAEGLSDHNPVRARLAFPSDAIARGSAGTSGHVSPVGASD